MLNRHVSITRALSSCRPSRTTRATWVPTQFSWKQCASTKSIQDGQDEDKKNQSRRLSANHPEQVVVGSQNAVPQKRKRGRPRKHPVAEEGHSGSSSAVEPEDATSSPSTRSRRRQSSKSKSSDLPPRLTASASPDHHDLASFLAHAARAKLNPKSNVYKGTQYEYTCIETLSSKNYNFELRRTGRANDLGIDLVGWWKVPEWPSSSVGGGREIDPKGGQAEAGDSSSQKKRKSFRPLKVIAQCKALSPTPAMIRELEGAYVGAPSGWNSSSDVLAFLISSGPATKGTLAALQRSRWPMGMLQITREGQVKQFVWNAVAAESGLTGMGIVVRYSQQKSREADDEDDVTESVRLSWLGRIWRA